MTVSPDYVIALVFNTYVPFPGWETKGFETLRFEDLGGQVSPHRCVAEFSGPRVRERWRWAGVPASACYLLCPKMCVYSILAIVFEAANILFSYTFAAADHKGALTWVSVSYHIVWPSPQCLPPSRCFAGLCDLSI